MKFYVFCWLKGGRLSAPGASVLLRYSTAVRPGSFSTAEEIPVPLDALVQDVDAASEDFAQLLAPTAPSLASTATALQLVTYRLWLDLAGAQVGDILTIAPLAALHLRIQLPHGTECPALRSGSPIGMYIPWQSDGCRFVRRPEPPSGAADASNAVEIEITDNSSLAEGQTLEFAFFAPQRGSTLGWLLVLRGSANGTARVQELGPASARLDGLSIEPRPSGLLLAVGSSAFGAKSLVVEVSVTLGVELRSVYSGAVILRTTSLSSTIVSCESVELVSGSAAAALMRLNADSRPECRFESTGRYLPLDAPLRFRIVADNAREVSGGATCLTLLVQCRFSSNVVNHVANILDP